MQLDYWLLDQPSDARSDSPIANPMGRIGERGNRSWSENREAAPSPQKRAHLVRPVLRMHCACAAELRYGGVNVA
nr:hypothetical protein CFP56_46815 [Quercus suber]